MTQHPNARLRVRLSIPHDYSEPTSAEQRWDSEGGAWSDIDIRSSVREPAVSR